MLAHSRHSISSSLYTARLIHFRKHVLRVYFVPGALLGAAHRRAEKMSGKRMGVGVKDLRSNPNSTIYQPGNLGQWTD